jgi:hypothetical protein
METNSVTSSVLETATFRLVVYCLNQLRYRILRLIFSAAKKYEDDLEISQSNISRLRRKLASVLLQYHCLRVKTHLHLNNNNNNP